MKRLITILLIIVIAVLLIPSTGIAQQIEGEIEYQLHDLEERVEDLESEINPTASPGIMMFLFGVF
jgi:hypothetical protein